MADISGPTSSLPGSIHKSSKDMMCDDHQDRLAIIRIQGETDSFGAEYLDMCQECYDMYLQYLQDVKDDTNRCDWCKLESKDVKPFRDSDEGLYGPVYNVCPKCRQKHNNSL